MNRCKQRIDKKDTFDNVIFTDESTIHLYSATTGSIMEEKDGKKTEVHAQALTIKSCVGWHIEARSPTAGDV